LHQTKTQLKIAQMSVVPHMVIVSTHIDKLYTDPFHTNSITTAATFETITKKGHSKATRGIIVQWYNVNLT